jgi:putative transcriptional regulator
MELKEIRKNKGLKQYEVAKMLGVTKDYISMLERGKRTPSSRLIRKMAEIYNVPPEQIFLAVCGTISSETA